MNAEAALPFLEDLLSEFLDPRKRVFWGYLLSACLIAVCWQIWRNGATLRQAFAHFFDRQAWLSSSAFADYRVMVLNSAIMSALSPRLLSQLGVSVLVFQWMHGFFEGRPGPPVSLPGWAVAILFTFSLFVLDDLARYVVHRLLHRVPFLWSFHKVHHTATSLNPLTVYRTHPVEGVIFVLRGAVVHGACIAMFVFFFGQQASLATVLGAGVFNFAFNALGANLRHSHIALAFWKPVELVFISPAQHQVHHSMAHRHRDKNFGAALAIWDVLFRTHHFSETERNLRFGVKGETSSQSHTLVSLYWQPFTEAGIAMLRMHNDLKKLWALFPTGIVFRYTELARVLLLVLVSQTRSRGPSNPIRPTESGNPQRCSLEVSERPVFQYRRRVISTEPVRYVGSCSVPACWIGRTTSVACYCNQLS